LQTNENWCVKVGLSLLAPFNFQDISCPIPERGRVKLVWWQKDEKYRKNIIACSPVQGQRSQTDRILCRLSLLDFPHLRLINPILSPENFEAYGAEM
jgi:hypothetical protein